MALPNDYNTTDEAKFYNAVNLACDGDYVKIKNLNCRSWKEAWQKINNRHPNLNPEKEMARLSKLNIKLILQDDPDYPPLLKEISFPPFGIYALGSIPLYPAVSIVGTRKATDHGKKIATQLANDFAKEEITVVSGLALGIDESAHWGVVRASGLTIAVLARGLDEIYPSQNKNLADKIVSLGGAIISEYPLGAPPYPARFLERNRIISGLSLAIIVVEAPIRSGSVATANFAIQQNREVFVIPGPINNKNYEGSHLLIKAGASLLTGINDFFESLPYLKNQSDSKIIIRSNDSPPLDANQKIIFSTIESSGQPITIDKILETVKLSPQVINQSLSMLIINNLVKESGGRYYI